MDSAKTTNFYFTGLTESSVLETDSKEGALKFIILQNDHFHQRVDELGVENRELRGNCDELEDRSSLLEKKVAALRGYLVNEHQLTCLYQDLTRHLQERQILSERFHLLERAHVALSVVVTWTLFWASHSLQWSAVLGFFLWMLVAGFLGFSYHRYRTQHQSRMKFFDQAKVQKEIDETIKANELLDKLLENF
jgi:hypothetical protein